MVAREHTFIGDAASSVLDAAISILTGSWISPSARRTRMINKTKNPIICALIASNILTFGLLAMKDFSVGGFFGFKTSKPQSSVVIELGDPYSALNKLIPSFAESSQFLVDFSNHQHSLERLHSHVATAELETKDELMLSLGNAASLSYVIEEAYSEIVERGVTVAYHASAYYTVCNEFFQKYTATGKRADKIQYINAVIGTAVQISDQMEAYYNLANTTHINVVALRAETIAIKHLKDYEAKKLGLHLNKDVKIQAQQIWGFSPPNIDQLVVEDIHDMCEDSDRFLSNLKRRIDQINNSLKVQIEGLRDMEGRADNEKDIIGLNQIMVGATNDLKIVMIQMRGHADMLEKAGNSGIDERKDEDGKGKDIKSEL